MEGLLIGILISSNTSFFINCLLYVTHFLYDYFWYNFSIIYSKNGRTFDETNFDCLFYLVELTSHTCSL